VTLCQICHSALTEARKIVRLSEDSLGPVSVPERDWPSVFEFWALNDRQLPMKVARESWNQTADQYMLAGRESVAICEVDHNLPMVEALRCSRLLLSADGLADAEAHVQIG
jgi:hypothetical protein